MKRIITSIFLSLLSIIILSSPVFASTAPTVTTTSSTKVTGDSFTLTGNLSNLGSATTVYVYFEYGLTTAYGYTVVANESPMTATGAFNYTLTGLTGGQTYHFRSKAIGDQTAYGSDLTFTTELIAPDSISLLSAKVFRNTVVSGDMSVIFEYFLDYAYLPLTPPASSSFMFRLYDTNGTTYLTSQVPYVVFNAGYGKGCGSFYFSSLPISGWGASYVINISGSPAYFNTLPNSYNYALTPADYSSVTTQTENQVLAAAYIISVAKDIQTKYPNIGTLEGSSGTQEVLAAIGETYFRGAIPGIDSIAPSIFLTQSYVPTVTDFNYNASQGTTYRARSTMHDLWNGFSRLGTKVGTDGQTVACVIAIIIALALMLFTTYKGWGVEPGMLGGSILLTAAAILLGDAMLQMRLAIGLLAVILFFLQVFLKRA